MIAKLTGVFDSRGEDWLIVDVGGVGYLVYASARTLGLLPPPGGAISLAIETHVREDHIHLYGFGSAAERAWFRLLTTVQGVGARVALAILSVLDVDQLARAIAASDRAALSRAPGVGAKLAGRIASELKDLAAELAFAPSAAARNAVPSPDGTPARAAAEPSNDAVAALVHLGYGRTEAFGAVAQAMRALAPDAPLADVIRAGLKELAR